MYDEWKRNRVRPVPPATFPPAISPPQSPQQRDELEIEENITAETNSLNETDDINENLTAIINLISKPQRGRARLLIEWIKPHVRITSTGRWRPNENEIADPIYDLVKFFTAPPQLKIERPISAPAFYKFLQRIDTPRSAISRSDLGFDLNIPIKQKIPWIHRLTSN